MVELNKDKEKSILNAARDIFIRKGLKGARMQEIANAAGINKALLHYYFRSKNKLFRAIFNEAFKRFMPRLDKINDVDVSVYEKLEFFVDNYINLLSKNPFLPGFVLEEMNREPEIVVEMVEALGINFDLVISQIEVEIEQGKIRKMSPRHLLANIIAMCIFPFAAKPMVQAVLLDNDNEKFNQFVTERKQEVKDFVFAAIAPVKSKD